MSHVVCAAAGATLFSALLIEKRSLILSNIHFKKISDALMINADQTPKFVATDWQQKVKSISCTLVHVTGDLKHVGAS